MNKILVVSVHPDDETLGCGGTLLKHKYCKDELYWLIVTHIDTTNGYSADKVQKRQKEIQQVADAYAFKALFSLDIPTTKVDCVNKNDLIKKISSIVTTVEPSIVYLPFQNDIHSDHRIVFEAAYSCTKTFRYPFLKRILMMETLSETEFSVSLPGQNFVPNVFVDISDFLDEKIKIIKIYESEFQEHPFPRSEQNIKALATFRGATAGCIYAEAFMLLKEIC